MAVVEVATAASEGRVAEKPSQFLFPHEVGTSLRTRPDSPITFAEMNTVARGQNLFAYRAGQSTCITSRHALLEGDSVCAIGWCRIPLLLRQSGHNRRELRGDSEANHAIEGT